MEHVGDVDETAQILSSFTAGSIDADECFCLILSFEGYEHTRVEFLRKIDFYKLTNPVKYKHLFDVYVTYFEKPPTTEFTDPVGASVENGYLTSDFGYELDMEMALADSLSKQDLEDNVKLQGSYSLFPSALDKVSASHGKVLSYANVTQNERLKSSSNTANSSARNFDEGNICRTTSDDSAALIQRSTPASVKPSLPPGLSIEPQKAKNKRKKKSAKNGSTIQRPLSSKPVIYWFRRDLRLYDNPALQAAAEEGGPVIFTFLWTEKEEDPNNVLAMGGATKLWLHHALKALSDDLVEKYGHGIVYRKTDNTVNEMKRLVSETGAKTVVINNVYEPFLSCRDDKLCKVLTERGVSCKRFDSYLLHEPSSVTTESIGMRGIGSVTHFMECCRQSATKSIGQPLDVPGHVPRVASVPERHQLEQLGLAKMPRRRDGTIIDWAAPIRKQWDFGETGAWNALSLFLEEGIRKYEKESCRADNLNTCRISPYLHFGQISPRAVLTEARGMKSPKFLRKLAWRDLSYWLLTLWPDLPSQPIRVHYRDQRWSNNAAHLKAWQKGNTGFPLIDAAMRQLWLTGWVNNYMRHVVASFLISYLHLHWIEGYRWFQDTLVDADVAINAMMWQNGGMSGLDQWNFVMHPVDAALTCDPDGTYVRQWCPELARLPNDFIHQPWKCPPSIIKRCQVELGKTYPYRVITNLEDAREQSLRDVVNIRMKYPKYVDKHTGNDLVPLPNGLALPCITRKEFKYKTSNPEARDNPHTAVLKGYRSRKRDEAVAFANQRDFTASTMNECVMRKERLDRASQFSSVY